MLYSDRFIFCKDRTLVSIESTKIRVGDLLGTLARRRDVEDFNRSRVGVPIWSLYQTSCCTNRLR